MAAGSTYTPIATTTVSGSSTSTVTFNSFSGYTDLVLIIGSLGTSADAQTPNLQFNSDTTGNYSATWLEGNGTSALSARGSNRAAINLGDSTMNSSGSLGTYVCNIMNYSNSSTYKTVIARQNVNGGSYPATGATVGLWRSTAAITSISVIVNSGVFNAGSTFTLYGILAA